MPSSTRRRTYKEEDEKFPASLALDPTRKKPKVVKEVPRLEVGNFLRIILGGDPPAMFEKVVSYLDPVSLGRLTMVHPTIRSSIRQQHWDRLVDCVSVPTTFATPTHFVRDRFPELQEIPTNMSPLERMKLWSKVSHYVDRVEKLNVNHFYADEEHRCKCRNWKKGCQLPNLSPEILGSDEYHFFVRFSYRREDDPWTTRLSWQSFVEFIGEEGSGMCLCMPHDLSTLRPDWPEMADFWEFRESFKMNAPEFFGEKMKLNHVLHKNLVVTVVALARNDPSYPCRLVYAASGHSNLRRLPERRVDPHSKSSTENTDGVDASFTFEHNHEGSNVRNRSLPPVLSVNLRRNLFAR